VPRSVAFVLVALLAGCEQRTSSSLAAVIPSPTDTTHDLSGTVRSAAGAPITDATVTFTAGRRATTVTLANASGFYRIAGLDSGTIVLTVSAPGYVAATRSILILDDVVLDVALDPIE
jgi:hypothetical protein